MVTGAGATERCDECWTANGQDARDLFFSASWVVVGDASRAVVHVLGARESKLPEV